MAQNNRWNTRKVEELIENYKLTGVIPMVNPFWKRNLQWRKPNIVFEYTEEEIAKMAYYNDDPVSFGQNECKVMTDDGVNNVKLRDYQIDLVRSFNDYRRNVVMASRQCGKCVTFDTMVDVISAEGNETKIPIFELHYLMKEQTSGLSVVDKLKLWTYRQLIM